MKTAKHNIIQLLREGYTIQYLAKLMYGENKIENTPPPKEQLLNVFRNKNSFKAIATSLGVPEKTVKTWFKSYDLPVTLKEMRKIIQ